MRVLLVKPYPELLVARRLQEGFLHLEPLELEIVAGGVPSTDEVKILDLSLEKVNPLKVFETEINNWQPELVGFGGYSTNIEVVKALALKAKIIKPDIIAIVGGIHATLLPEDYALPQIDLIVRGEGGVVLKEIIERFKDKRPLFFNDTCLSQRDPQFLIKARLPPPAYPDINEIPLPRRDLVERRRYFCVWTSSRLGRLDSLFPSVASMRTSLGCAYSCSFCVIPHLMRGKYLQRSAESVVQEVASLKEKYIYFLDDEMFLNAKRCREIAKLLINANVQKEYISWARSDTIVNDPDLFRLWRQAGLSTVYVGIESMDENRLDEYKKMISSQINRKAISILKEIGITLHAAFIVHPDFSVKDFKKLEREVLSLCPAEVTFTVLSPSPGTPFWNVNKERFICDPYRFYDCMHTILPTRLSLRKFYKHFSRLTSLALRANPLRVNKIKVPLRDFMRAIIRGTRYIIALQLIHRDYPQEIK